MMNARLALALIALGPFKSSLGAEPAVTPDSTKRPAAGQPQGAVPGPAADPIASLAEEWLAKR